MARLLTALFLLQTLLAPPAQAGFLLFPASNQPQVHIERSQAAINVIAAGNRLQGNAAQSLKGADGNFSADKATSVGISISLGSSQSESQTTYQNQQPSAAA